MKALGVLINTLNKLRAILITLSLLSLAVTIYNIIQIVKKESTIEDVQPSDIAIHVIMFMVTCLTFLVNLLLYQGALDLSSINLYFWPDPKYCKIWWMMVYVPISCVYFYGAATCFYLKLKNLNHGNVFIGVEDNFIAWGFIYLASDVLVIVCIYFVNKLYSKF